MDNIFHVLVGSLIHEHLEGYCEVLKLRKAVFNDISQYLAHPREGVHPPPPTYKTFF